MSYAGFWKRFAAALIDYFIYIVFVIVLYIGLAYGVTWDSGGTEATGNLRIIADMASTIFGWIYFAGMESSSSQGTLGKMALGIKVTDLEGDRIGFAKATGRYFGKIISTMMLLAGFIMVAFTEKKQGLHDMMASCLVINKE